MFQHRTDLGFGCCQSSFRAVFFISLLPLILINYIDLKVLKTFCNFSSMNEPGQTDRRVHYKVMQLHSLSLKKKATP